MAGEGDYRGICVRRIDGKDYVRSIGPWIETTLCPLPNAGWNKFRLDYHPASGWTYSVNGNVVGTEALSHKGAALTARPHVGCTLPTSFPAPLPKAACGLCGFGGWMSAFLALRRSDPPGLPALFSKATRARLVTAWPHAGIVVDGELMHATLAKGLHASL